MADSAPLDHLDDGALVLAVQRGHADAFAELFRRHYPAVRRACARRLPDAHDADEVAQAAFVRAFERIEQCAGDRRFGPWVHVIARSMSVDAYRAQARVEPREHPLAGGHDHRPNEPEESLLSNERAAQMKEALASLPDRQRRAVIARDWEELRPGEIADRLGLTVGAVDSLLLRARRRLALAYSHLAGEGGGGIGILPFRSAAAAIVVALALGSQAFTGAATAAARAVQDTAGEVVNAVVSAAASIGGIEVPAPEPEPQAPPPVAAWAEPVRPAPTAGVPADPRQAGPPAGPAPVATAASATQAPEPPAGADTTRRAATEPPSTTASVPNPPAPALRPAASPAVPAVPPGVVDVGLPPLAAPAPAGASGPATAPPSAPVVDRLPVPALPGVPEAALPLPKLPLG